MSVEEKVANGREVLADVGRLGARWILWSRKRLGLTLLAVLLVGLAIGQLTGPAHPGTASKPTAATTGTVTGISPGGAPLDDHWTRTPDPTRTADEATAVKFVAVWLSHTPAATWLPGVQALTTPAMGAGFVGVDPAVIPGTKLTGPGVWSPLGVTVPTDAGSVIVTFGSDGKVSDIEPTSSAPSGANVAMGR